jgi:hypothetical protein
MLSAAKPQPNIFNHYYLWHKLTLICADYSLSQLCHSREYGNP